MHNNKRSNIILLIEITKNMEVFLQFSTLLF